jgi:diaminopimelate decarboxylase
MVADVKYEQKAKQAVPYRLRPKMHPIVRDALSQKEMIFDLVEKYGSPLNLVFPQIFREKYELFDQMLEGEHLNYRLYYTCKPNRSNALLKEAASLNAYVDVSSLGEFEAALKAGIAPDRLSATGPKNKAYMDIILQNNSMCVIDNWHEFDYVAENAQNGQPVMVRLSKPITNSATPDYTFGIAYNELDSIINRLLETEYFDFHGFAAHYNYATDTNIDHIETVTSATLQAFEKGLIPQAINIGGGFLTRYIDCKEEWNAFIHKIKGSLKGDNDPVTWDGNGMGFRLQNGTVIGSEAFINHIEPVTGENHLEKIIHQPLKCLDNTPLIDFIRDSGLSLYVEPGRALMDQCGVTLANINFTKKSSKENVLINLDMHHANLNAHTFRYMAEPILIHKNDTLPINDEGVYYYGSLCFTSDLITFHKTFPDHLPENNDIAAFVNTAAYRMDFTESEMLRHPNAKKICLFQNNNEWQTSIDKE